MQEKYGDKLEFRQIVLMHIKKILEISSEELRNKTTTKNHGTFSETIENEDTRFSFIQSIKILAYILIPYFDGKVKSVYEDSIKIINSFDYEIKEILKEEHKELCEKAEKEDLWDILILQMKIRSAENLFIALNLLLKRHEYLKSAVYGEDKDEVVEEKKEEED